MFVSRFPRRRALAVCLMGAAFALTPSAQAVADDGEATAADEKWVSLFDGKSLDGWTPKIRTHAAGENYANTFRVEDGLLTVSYDGGYEDGFKAQYGHLFYKDTFSHYRMRLQYRFIGEQVDGGAGWALRNSGVMIHGQSPESMGKDQEFPVSIEVQLLGGDGKNQRTTGNLCTPGTNVVMDGELKKNHCFTSTSETYHGDQWVTAEIEVHGDKVIRHLINGEEVFKYEAPQLDPRDADAKKLIEAADGELLLSGGTISLQSESHPCQFRKIEILELPAE
ncbi:3-keto-disaccharide hydrolase [Alienimonas chondri]|uniref:3-keto-alpha-glucoside-1,2-lyase/3-keto-2-hydroxy-glucal hydratase domain-containing protein n=1 Tax=Alienimonas chondri TaxID=2681879 RepID=A0ABX1VLD6_9PLAN|nr:DUF1080 domain-containing protein [Alienimonas chondri]NNJ27421.1 hypothetical protein [Alienimonas chondri]